MRGAVVEPHILRIGATLSAMSRSPDWKRILAAVTAYLPPGERPTVLFTAVNPSPESRGLIVTSGLVPLFWAARRVARERAARAVGREAGVPVAPRMIIALTPSRMVIWRAARGWRLGELSGELPRGLIAGATAAARGSHSQRVILHLATGASAVIRVTPVVADQLTKMLSGEIQDSA